MNEEVYGIGHIWWRGEVHGALVGKPEGKRPLARTRHRWVDKYQSGS